MVFGLNCRTELDYFYLSAVSICEELFSIGKRSRFLLYVGLITIVALRRIGETVLSRLLDVFYFLELSDAIMTT